MFPAFGSNQTQHLDLPARFMSLGVVALLLSALVAPWAIDDFGGGFYQSRVLAFVHLNTIGVIASILMGASYQLLSVVLQRELLGVRLARISFWFHLVGVTLFVSGLWQSWRPGIALGAALLFTGLLLYVAVVSVTIWFATVRSIVVWHIVAGMVGLVGGVSLGFLLALNKGAGFLGGHTLQLLATHALLMVVGWVLMMFNGVAYQLVGMFTLAEDQMRDRLRQGVLLLTVVGVWSLALIIALGAGYTVASVAALVLLGGQLLFAYQMALVYRKRRRRAIDVHMPFAIVAIICIMLALVLMCGGLLAGVPPSDMHWIVVGWLAIFGFAITAIQGFLYKISTFLVWLYSYAPLAGKVRTPRLEELYSSRLAFAGWLIWSAGMALVTMLILADRVEVAHWAGFSLTVGVVLFLVNMARIASHWLSAPDEQSIAGAQMSAPGVRMKGSS